MSKIKTVGITLGVSSALLLAACGDDTENKENSTGTSSSSIGEQVNYTVVATEPGAGLTGLSHEVLEQYENLEGWTLQESSTAGMLSTLDKAIRNEEPVIVTGWTPHWKFSAYDLKILEDPKGILGGAENIQTLARKGLEQDLPDVYTVLDRFYWEPEDMEKVMYDAQEDGDFNVAAVDWVENNQDKVSEWTKDIAQGNGEKVKIISTPWDSEFASSSVIKVVLEQLGYEPEVTPVDPAIMFQSIATGEGDVTVAPWLPTTHKAFYDKHKDDIVDLGENLEGTQNGFVVPAYVEIDSIEDLKPKE